MDQVAGEVGRDDGPRLFSPSRLAPKTVLTVCVVVAVFAAGVYVLRHTPAALGVTIAAMLLAMALDHAVGALARRRIPRGAAIALVMLALLATMVGIGFVLVPPAIEQLRALLEQVRETVASAPSSTWYQRLGHFVDLDGLTRRLQAWIVSSSASLATTALSLAVKLLMAVGAVVTVLFVTLFMLTEGGRMVASALDESRPERRPLYRRMLGRAYDALGKYLAGLALLCLAHALAAGGFLFIIGVPFFLPLGVIAGLSSFIPVVGATLAGVLLTSAALLVKGHWAALAMLIFFLVYQQLENHVLAPLIYQRTVQINPLVSILAVLFFGDLAGIRGAIVAVPAVAAAQVVLVEILALRREQLAIGPAAPEH